MLPETLADYTDTLHAQLCYQLFITPIHLPIPKEYREFSQKACDYLAQNRTGLVQFQEPRHHVIHHFAQPKNKKAPKILITHGWMSRAAYMACFIRTLHNEGYEIYALDFPAHGDSRGVQLPWIDAVKILRQTLNRFGPFYAVLGHSFGGSMLLNMLNLSHQLPEWKLNDEPERVIMLGSPTRMRTPVSRIARRLNLSGHGYYLFRNLIERNAHLPIKNLDFRHYINQATTPFLCVHGENDSTVVPEESIVFCEQYEHAQLNLVKDADHISILYDPRVEDAICEFVASPSLNPRFGDSV